jgi:hypothetical protein
VDYLNMSLFEVLVIGILLCGVPQLVILFTARRRAAKQTSPAEQPPRSIGSVSERDYYNRSFQFASCDVADLLDRKCIETGLGAATFSPEDLDLFLNSALVSEALCHTTPDTLIEVCMRTNLTEERIALLHRHITAAAFLYNYPIPRALVLIDAETYAIIAAYLIATQSSPLNVHLESYIEPTAFASTPAELVTYIVTLEDVCSKLRLMFSTWVEQRARFPAFNTIFRTLQKRYPDSEFDPAIVKAAMTYICTHLSAGIPRDCYAMDPVLYRRLILEGYIVIASLELPAKTKVEVPA